MLTRQTVEIDLRQSRYWPAASVADPTQPGGPGTTFAFELCRKPATLGPMRLDQWWLAKPGLYGERGADSPNRQAVIDCYWALCLAEGSALDDRRVQESYILANLLPLARSNGSKRVFADASLTRDRDEEELDRSASLANLERMLSSARCEEIDVPSFYTGTRDVLGPPEYEPTVRNCYEKFRAELMDETCAALRRSGVHGLHASMDHWKEKMRTTGRRSGRNQEKTVLDVMSYEGRAAFHQCHSAVWLVLLEELSRRFSLTDQAVLFHRLWHLDQTLPSDQEESKFHLFHGHIFGLHPAGSDLICTTTGGRLVGELVAAPDDLPRHRRFLNGMLIACYDYARRNNVCKQLRKKQPWESIDGSMETLEEQQILRRQGRRRKPRRSDES